MDEAEISEPQAVEKIAKCRRYESELGWYGLMTIDGNISMPPLYTEIEAINNDLYLCRDMRYMVFYLMGMAKECISL